MSTRPKSRHFRVFRSLTAKAVLLALIFLVVPVILYMRFQAADEEKQQVLLQSVREQGRLLSQALAPVLSGPARPALPQLGGELERFADDVTNIKLLFAPGGTPATAGTFFYIASWPAVSPAHLDAERDRLEGQGILDRLGRTCEGELPFALRYATPQGGDEVVTSVTPIKAPSGCWAVVTSFSAAAIPGSHLGIPYWATPEVKLGAIIYMAMAVLTLSTFWSVRRGLRHFAERARAIRDQGPTAGPFSAHNEIPELGEVAAEFDRMVEVLHKSANDIRRAAEDNAHAFKTPIAVIRQSLEPLKRAIPEDNQRGIRALGLIESSLDRLDGLVASSRRLDEATADLIDTTRTDLNLSELLKRLLQAHAGVFTQRGIGLRSAIAPRVRVRANQEMIETVVENLLDNALSFSPRGESIGVRLEARGDRAELVIADAGPGVPPADLDRIFERYFSQRPTQDSAEDHPATHFGIGLWIARRNIEALGGAIAAENGCPAGLVMRVALPLSKTGGTVIPG